jgi:hypothetical protein
MKQTIELTYEQKDLIVINELKSCIQDILDDPWSFHHNMEKSMEDIASFLRVLGYFLTTDQLGEYENSLDFSNFELHDHGKNSVVIDKIIENPDGSAEIHFTASQESMKVLAAEGAKYILMKAAGKIDADPVANFSLNDMYDL